MFSFSILKRGRHFFFTNARFYRLWTTMRHLTLLKNKCENFIYIFCIFTVTKNLPWNFSINLKAVATCYLKLTWLIFSISRNLTMKCSKQAPDQRLRWPESGVCRTLMKDEKIVPFTGIDNIKLFYHYYWIGFLNRQSWWSFTGIAKWISNDKGKLLDRLKFKGFVLQNKMFRFWTKILFWRILRYHCSVLNPMFVENSNYVDSIFVKTKEIDKTI